jgi:hypothetical protein
MNGFDITLITDHTKLQPFGVDLSSSMLATDSISTECIAGLAAIGSCGNQALYNLDTIQVGLGGAAFTPNPSFGVLFTAIFNIVGNTTSASIGFRTGCGSLTSLPPLCVTLTSGGSVNVVVQAVQTATYTTSTSSPFQPFFALTTKPLVLNYTAGTVGTGANSVITMAEFNGFSCGGLNCITLSYIKPAAAGLTIGLNPTQISDAPSNTATLSVNIAAITPAGIYTIYIVGVPGTGANGPSPGTTYLGAVTNVTLTVVPSSNFAMTSSPSTIITMIGTPGTSTIIVAGGKIFTGIVSLTTSITPSTGLACTMSPTTVTSTNSPWLKKSLLSCTSTTGGTFSVTVTGTSGFITQTATVAFITPSFSLTASPTSLTIKPGLSSTSTISLQSVSGFSGTVILSASVTPAGAGESLSLTSATLTPGGTNSSVLTTTIPPTAAGIYTVTVTGVSGSITQTASVVVSTGAANIVITSITQSPSSPTAGQIVTFTVKLNNTGAAAGNFSLWINWGSVKVAGPLNDTIPSGQAKTVTLTWDTTGYAAASNPILAVLSTAGGNNGPSSQLSGQSLPLAAAPPPIFSTTVIAVIAGVIAVAAIALAIILLRRRKTTKIV